MKPRWWKCLAFACLPLLVPARSRAQPLFGHAESLQLTVDNADVVVVGKILDVGGDGMSDRGEWRGATILVEQTLKGEHSRLLRVRLDPRAKAIELWKDRPRRLLLAIQDDPPTVATVVDLDDEALEILASDFTLLRTPGDVIRLAGEAAREMPGVRRIRNVHFAVPFEAVETTRWRSYYGTGGHLVLGIPVDGRLEKRAIELIRSRDSLRRLEGLQALRFFKSDANVDRVKSLLDDPSLAYARRAAENRGLEVRIYLVRREAYQTLQSWGVEVKEPVVTEETLKLGEVTLVDLANSKVTESDFKALARFENLEALVLSNDVLTEACLKEIGALKGLRTLSIGGTTIRDEWLEHLSRLETLWDLSVGTTQVADEGLKMLVGFKALKKLDVRQTRVTDQGLAEFRKLRPEIVIER